jgi:hypothetical protein
VGGGDITPAPTPADSPSPQDEAVVVSEAAAPLLGAISTSTFSRIGSTPLDNVYQFCPDLSDIFWRWFTRPAGRKPLPIGLTGDFTDGFGNRFRMLAVANPERKTLLAQNLRQRFILPEEEAKAGLGDEIRTSQGDGYGIVRFDKAARKITVECWPYRADPARATGSTKDGRNPWLRRTGWAEQLHGCRISTVRHGESVVQITDRAGNRKGTRPRGDLVAACSGTAVHIPGVRSGAGPVVDGERPEARDREGAASFVSL